MTEIDKDTEAIYKKLREVEYALSSEKCELIDLDDMFDFHDGKDFTYDEAEAGDWNAYRCGSKGCERGWHKIAYAMNMGREDGKRWVEVLDCDEDGNWDFNTGYDEREGDEPGGDAHREVSRHINHSMDEHFIGWVRYHLDCFSTGEDPLDEFFSDSEYPAIRHLNAAMDNLKYLDKSLDRKKKV